MLQHLLLLCAFLGQQQSSVVVTTHPGAGEVQLWGQGLPDGKYFEYVVPEADFAKLTEWEPEKEVPLLPIAKAISIAKRTTRAEHPEFADLMPWNIQINQSSSLDRRNRWFYVIELYPLVKGQPSIYSHVTVVVLMDGTVVKPREKQRTPQ